MNKYKRKRGKRKLNIFICVLKNRHTEYVEVIAQNLPLANTIAEKAYPGEIDFVYKAGRHSGSNLTKITTISKEVLETNELFTSTGDHNTD